MRGADIELVAGIDPEIGRAVGLGGAGKGLPLDAKSHQPDLEIMRSRLLVPGDADVRRCADDMRVRPRGAKVGEPLVGDSSVKAQLHVPAAIDHRVSAGPEYRGAEPLVEDRPGVRERHELRDEVGETPYGRRVP